MLTGTDIPAHINAPEGLAFEGKAVDIDIIGVACLRIVQSLTFPFKEYLILSVTVNIANDAVIWSILRTGTIQGNVEVIRTGIEMAVLRGNNSAVYHCVNTVFGICISSVILIAGCSGSGFARIDELTVTAEPELSIVCIISVPAPAHEHSVSGLYCIDTTVKMLDDILSCPILCGCWHCSYISRHCTYSYHQCGRICLKFSESHFYHLSESFNVFCNSILEQIMN